MCDIKLKLLDTDSNVVVASRKGLGSMGFRGDLNMVMEDGMTLDGGHTVQYKDPVS